MIHTTTQSDSFAIRHNGTTTATTAYAPVPPNPLPAARTTGRRPIERTLEINTKKKGRSRFDDILSLVLLCGLMLFVLAGTAWMVREFIDALVKLNSFGLVRALAGV